MLDDLSFDSVWWCPDCGEPREVCKGECGQRAQDDVNENDEAVEQSVQADGASDQVCPECGAKLNYCTECEKRVTPRR